MSNATPPPSTPAQPDGRIMIPVGPRELLLGVTFLLGGGLAGLTGNTFTDPKLPPDVKQSVDAAKTAADDVNKSLGEIKTTLRVMEERNTTDRRDASDLKDRVKAVENEVAAIKQRVR